jgi:hypothetical protein
MADSKAASFIRKMKTRDMRVPILEDFKPGDLEFDGERMVALIVEEQLPLDFMADTMVEFAEPRSSFMNWEWTRSWRLLESISAKSLLPAWMEKNRQRSK